MSKNKSSAKPAILPLFALDKTSKQIYTENTKSAADERLALSAVQRNEPTTLGSMGGSFLVYVDEDLNDQSCGHDD